MGRRHKLIDGCDCPPPAAPARDPPPGVGGEGCNGNTTSIAAGPAQLDRTSQDQRSGRPDVGGMAPVGLHDATSTSSALSICSRSAILRRGGGGWVGARVRMARAGPGTWPRLRREARLARCKVNDIRRGPSHRTKEFPYLPSLPAVHARRPARRPVIMRTVLPIMHRHRDHCGGAGGSIARLRDIGTLSAAEHQVTVHLLELPAREQQPRGGQPGGVNARQVGRPLRAQGTRSTVTAHANPTVTARARDIRAAPRTLARDAHAQHTRGDTSVSLSLEPPRNRFYRIRDRTTKVVVRRRLAYIRH